MAASSMKDLSVTDLAMVIAVCAVAAWGLWELGEWAREGLAGFGEYVGDAEETYQRVRRRKRTGGPRIFLFALGYGGPLVSVILGGFGLYSAFYLVRGLVRRD